MKILLEDFNVSYANFVASGQASEGYAQSLISFCEFLIIPLQSSEIFKSNSSLLDLVLSRMFLSVGKSEHILLPVYFYHSLLDIFLQLNFKRNSKENSSFNFKKADFVVKICVKRIGQI